MWESFHQAQDPSSRNEVGFHVQCLQHLVHLQHVGKCLWEKSRTRELPWARMEQIQAVPGAAFRSMPLCLLSRNLPWPPNTPSGDRSSGLRDLWTCFSSLRSPGLLGLLHTLSAFPPLSLSLLHLITWKVLFYLAKSCSSFKALSQCLWLQELC